MISRTDEQQEIVDTVATGAETAIEAGAGCGKSTVLLMTATEEAAKGRRGLVIYFNRKPALEAKHKFHGVAEASTAHSLAWHAMRDRPFMQRLDGPPVTAKYLAEDVFKLRKWFPVPGRKSISTWKIASLAVQTVTRFCYSDATEIKPWHVPQVEGVTGEVEKELRNEVVPIAMKVWEDLQQPFGFARFEPDHYMKIWALEDPKLQADYLMVDESQDTNGVLAGVIRKQTHLQRVLVGDSQQRLFGWRGTVDMMREIPDAEVRYLTQSFRFGDAVADEANRWLEYLESPLRLRGLPTISSRLDFVEHPDAILCRTNAATVENAMAGQDLGFDVAIVGDVGSQMSSFAAGVEELQRTGKSRHRELSVFKSWADVQAYVYDEAPGGNFATAVRLIERYGTGPIQAVCARCVDESKADFVVSTVHKVKGMEWPSVRLDSGIVPESVIGQEDQMSTGDLMVAYVASTRAKELLDDTAVRGFHHRRKLMREIAKRAEANVGQKADVRPD